MEQTRKKIMREPSFFFNLKFIGRKSAAGLLEITPSRRETWPLCQEVSGAVKRLPKLPFRRASLCSRLSFLLGFLQSTWVPGAGCARPPVAVENLCSGHLYRETQNTLVYYFTGTGARHMHNAHIYTQAGSVAENFTNDFMSTGIC